MLFQTLMILFLVCIAMTIMYYKLEDKYRGKGVILYSIIGVSVIMYTSMIIT